MPGYSLENQVVLIAGGSQGLGKEFARRYYKESEKSTIIVVSRSRQKLHQAVRDITGTENTVELTTDAKPHDGRSRIMYMACDLSVYDEVEKLYNVLLAGTLVPTQVLMCAGGSHPGLFKDLTGAQLELGVRVNYLTCLNLAHVAVRRSPLCHLVFFSSETAFFPFIGYTQYAPLKQSIKSLVAILRQECQYQRISCVYPGNFKSEGYELENETKPTITQAIEGSSHPISCEKCCTRIIRSLSAGYDDVITDFIGWVLMSTDMGLNKQSTRSFAWFAQWLLGILANLVIIPIYMLICAFQIRQWHQNRSKN
ncbi:LAMI_0H10682g1_1 [Lachancea mirantina]|uniref:3-ketodihydrosphingosine reductase TSC10 n=1 Tax=Lachancea mirantina TaxID=1230905 RepID=A0A1G4KGX5_9SACH|nr:LAMI_0H10682g1_1 [Lachancea mirantina]